MDFVFLKRSKFMEKRLNFLWSDSLLAIKLGGSKVNSSKVGIFRVLPLPDICT